MSVAFAVLCRLADFPAARRELIAANRLEVETCWLRSKGWGAGASRGNADGPGGGA